MEDNIKILSDQEVNYELKALPGWVYADQKISKEFQFASFMDGLEFLNELAPYCNEIDHHPDINISYKKIRFDLQRFSVGGKVTDRDFLVARKIDELFKSMYD